MSFYLVLFLLGAGMLTFWVLPALISALAPVGHREVIRELQRGARHRGGDDALGGGTAVGHGGDPQARRPLRDRGRRARRDHPHEPLGRLPAGSARKLLHLSLSGVRGLLLQGPARGPGPGAAPAHDAALRVRLAHLGGQCGRIPLGMARAPGRDPGALRRAADDHALLPGDRLGDGVRVPERARHPRLLRQAAAARSAAGRGAALPRARLRGHRLGRPPRPRILP